MAAADAATSTWRTATFPDSSPAVSLRRLGVDPDGAFTVLVRFPRGWSRPATGWYDQVEEVLILDGRLEMNGVGYRRGDHIWLPAGAARAGSHSTGALALAWFSGPPQWSTTPSPVAAGAAAGTVHRRWQDLPACHSPLGSGEGRMLSRSRDRSSWILDRTPVDTPVPVAVTALSLTDHAWAVAAPGEVLPHLAGPVSCALRHTGSVGRSLRQR